MFIILYYWEQRNFWDLSSSNSDSYKQVMHITSAHSGQDDWPLSSMSRITYEWVWLTFMNLGVIWTTYEIGLAHNVGEVEQDGRWSKRSHFRKTISPLGHFFLSPLFFFYKGSYYEISSTYLRSLSFSSSTACSSTVLQTLGQSWFVLEIGLHCRENSKS